MQTNFSYAINDLPLIIRLYRAQNKIQKSYRVTYLSRDGKKEDFIGAKDKNEVDEKVKELKDHGHKVLDIDILKAKVYVKNPGDAPQGMKLQEGERGGHYYETQLSSQNLENLQNDQDNKKINEKDSEKVKLLYANSEEIKKISNLIEISSVKSPLTKEYINNIIKKNNININDVSINILQFDIKDAFAFTLPINYNIIYLASTPDEKINTWLSNNQFALIAAGYDVNELKDINVDVKRIASIVHEIGHTKVNKKIYSTNMKYISELRDKEKEIFYEYFKYIFNNYPIGGDTTWLRENAIESQLDEMLAEDYRQIVGGNQAKIPNRYFYKWDTIHNENYKYKEGRLNILRKMGVF